jgi:sacsin
MLAAYQCGREQLNKMVQKVDDAGMTTINFIKDPWHDQRRCASTTTACSPKPIWGGGAIQRLDKGRKGTDQNSTGRYGVGFNCFYHLTDVPSFLTGGPDPGGSLRVFDPHARTYIVPGATRDEPGWRFTDTTRLKRLLKNVTSVYLEDVDFDTSNGMIFSDFRSLRDERMARDSESVDHA